MLPRLMGHEAACMVVETGLGVMHVKEGDTCVAHWRKGDGVESDNPKWNCQQTSVLDKMPYSGKGFTAGRITTFSQYSVLSENRLTAVPTDTPVELCALLGCGLSTAIGVIENEANLKIGESVLIIGCGGLGLNLILAAKLKQASKIVVIETMSEKYEMGIKLGASSMRPGFWLMDDESYDVVIDTTGSSGAIESAMKFLAPSGRFIMVGQPKPSENVTLTNARHMFDGQGKTIIATQGGGFCPSVDIKRYIAAYRAGRIDLNGIVSHRFPLEKINEALDCVRNGQAGRVMLDCNGN